MGGPGSMIKLVCAVDLAEPERARLHDLSPALLIEYVEPAAVALLKDDEVEVLIAGNLPKSAPELRWLQSPTAGVEHLVGKIPPGVVLTNAKGVFAVPIAEYVMWSMLQAAQDAEARRHLQQARRWPEHEDAFLGRRLRGLTAVVAGYGSAGREVARLANAFGMRVIAVKARPEITEDDGFRVPGTGDPKGVIPERILGVDRLAEAAREADFLILAMPSTSRNRSLVGRDVLVALPAGAWVVNVGRGAVLDEAALVEALRDGRLGGAVLDVFAQEPLTQRSPLWELPNMIVTPHVSGADAVGRANLIELICINLRRYLAHEPLLNVVDIAREY